MVPKVQMEEDLLLEEPQMRAAVTSYMVKMDHKLKEVCALKTIFTSLRALWNLKNKNSIVSTRKLLGFQIKLCQFKLEQIFMNKTILTILGIEFRRENANIGRHI